MIGMAAMTVPAITRFGASRFDLLSSRSPLWTVLRSASLMIRLGHRYWFHDERKLNSARAAQRRTHERDARRDG